MENTVQTTLEGACNSVRIALKAQGAYLMQLKNSVQSRESIQGEDKGEILANITLTYRHLEDASMRLGKVIQATNGGVSVYDKETTIGNTSGVTGA